MRDLSVKVSPAGVVVVWLVEPGREEGEEVAMRYL